MMQIRCAVLTVAVASLAMLAAGGCHVSSKGSNGKEDVDIRTPLGGLAVKTDPVAVLGKIGLPPYPGAVAIKERGDDKGSADVDMSFGNFRLRVLASSFQSDDDRAKVEAFYRKALQQYSDVIACQEDTPIGQPTRTGLGLTCREDRHVHTELRDEANRKDGQPEITLKAGSASHQHLVSVRPLQGGTRFSLVALDLPNGDDSK